jgi:hypothetical protein
MEDTSAEVAVQDQPAEKCGYGKPPTKNQFQKGKSGNARGRPPGRVGSKGILKLLNRLADENVQLTMKGKPVQITKKEAALIQAINKAAQGDDKALKLLLPHWVSADKAQAREVASSDLIKANSPIFQLAMGWIIDAFEAAIDDVKHIDIVTKNHIFECLRANLIGFEKKVDVLSAEWEPGKDFPSPFVKQVID